MCILVTCLADADAETTLFILIDVIDAHFMLRIMSNLLAIVDVVVANLDVDPNEHVDAANEVHDFQKSPYMSMSMQLISWCVDVWDAVVC